MMDMPGQTTYPHNQKLQSVPEIMHNVQILFRSDYKFVYVYLLGSAMGIRDMPIGSLSTLMWVTSDWVHTSPDTWKKESIVMSRINFCSSS